MKEFNIDGQIVKFNNFDSATEDIAKEYFDYANEHKADKTYIIERIIINILNGTVELQVVYKQTKEKINRIRRITGYLTGSIDSWNDAKKAELRDRVKHA